jgi:hypothetical protein
MPAKASAPSIFTSHPSAPFSGNLLRPKPPGAKAAEKSQIPPPFPWSMRPRNTSRYSKPSPFISGRVILLLSGIPDPESRRA